MHFLRGCPQIVLFATVTQLQPYAGSQSQCVASAAARGGGNAGGHGAGGKGRQDGSADDRRHPSQGASHGGEPAKKGALPRRIGRTKGGLNSKLHTVCDDRGRPRVMYK